MADRVALITGATGQDGAYLAELLLGKGYVVHGIKRRSSSFNTARVDHLYRDPHGSGVRFFLHYGDMTDATNLIRIVQEVQPTEIYNLAAQSHVRVSFETPEYTATPTRLARCGFLRPSVSSTWRRKCGFIRPRRLSFTALSRKCRSGRRRRFIRARLTPRRSFMPIGSPSITAKPIACTRQTAFCSITKVRRAAKPS